MDKFFIFDCNGRIVGNPNGYRTIRGAVRQQNQHGSPAYKAIWAAYDARANKNDNLVSRVTQLGGN